MKRAVFAVMAIAACARKAEYTPPIDVEPGAARRACYQSQRAELRDADPFPDDVSLACGTLLSDVKGPAIRLVVDDTHDAADE